MEKLGHAEFRAEHSKDREQATQRPARAEQGMDLSGKSLSEGEVDEEN